MLKATFRNNPTNFRETYCKNECILLISIGQEYYEGEKLESIIQLINRSQFQNCLIVIGDQNHAYNLSMSSIHPPEYFYDVANSIGDKWISRNFHILNKMTIPHKISRWKDWTSHHDFQKFYDLVKKDYETNKDCHESFNWSANEFLTRNPESNIDTHSKRTKELCIQYLMEECAIIMPLWSSLGIKLIIYPNKMIDAMFYCYCKFVDDFSREQMRWLTIRFKKLQNKTVAAPGFAQQRRAPETVKLQTVK